jgi:DNA-binding protein HU-beta
MARSLSARVLAILHVIMLDSFAAVGGFIFRFMSNVKKKEFAELLAKKMRTNDKTAEMWIDSFTDTLYECLKEGRGVTITNLGTFYLRITSRGGSIFRFNPSQKLRALFGLASTFKGNF